MKLQSFATSILLIVILLGLGIGVRSAAAQGPVGTAFTYQGQLKDGDNPANGAYDFQFALYDAASGGTQIGLTVSVNDLTVTNGLFTTQLDFGASAFNGNARYLEVRVRPGSSTGTYTTLTPRQQLTPAPYALALPGLYTQQNTTSPNLIGGYSSNSVTSGVSGATISGGGASSNANRVTDDYGTVGGGRNNQAGDNAGTTSDRTYATVGGGFQNTANGNYSFVVGRRAKNTNTSHSGVFIFADSNNFDFPSTTANQFRVRATGGAQFVLGIDGSGNPTWTCSVSNGGSWSCSSDRNLKENLALADGRAILETLSRLPLYTWSAKGGDPAVRHLGPMAQDFYAAFGLGDSDVAISTIDLDGVSLAAIQGLYQVVQEKDAEIANLKSQNSHLRSQIATLEARLSALEQRVGGDPAQAGGSSTWGIAAALLIGALGVVGYERVRWGGRK